MNPAGPITEPLEAPELSAEGLQRREAILELAEKALAQRRRRRQTGRIAGGVAMAAAIASLVYVAIPPHAPVAPSEPGARAEGAPAPDVANAIVASTEQRPSRLIQIIGDDPMIMSRLASTPGPCMTVAIDDAALLEMLAAVGRHEGLVRTGGAAYLSSEIRAAAAPLDETPSG